MTYTHAVATNAFGPAAFIVDATASNGSHTTIASAITAAVSGQTIFIKPGTYTENLTLKAGVNLTAYTCDGSLNTTSNVIILGKCTLTTAGTVNISGIQLKTNSDFLLAVTGTVNSIVNLRDCYLNASNNTGISFTTSGASSGINISNCFGDLGTTGIAIFAHSATGQMIIEYSDFTNTGASTTANTISAGTLGLKYTRVQNPITSSGTAGEVIDLSVLDANGQNVTMYTCGGSSGTHRILKTWVASGSASAISTSQTLECHDCVITSTNTNAITGAGTLNYSGLNFSSGITNAMNVTTTNGRNTMLGSISFDKGSNYLSTYTVGTWTPVIAPSGTAYTSIGFATQAGYYTRIGNMVTATCLCIVNAITVGPATGDARITGLPFTSDNSTNIQNFGPFRMGNVTLASTLWVQGVTAGNVTSITMQKYNTAAAASNVAASTITSTADTGCTMSYRV